MTNKLRIGRRWQSAAAFALVSVAGPIATAQQTDATAEAPALTRDSPFASEIYAFLVQDQVLGPQTCATLFTGSSSIRFWFTLDDDFPGHQTLNRGFGGSELDHVIDYFDLLATPHTPREIVLYAGENDISYGKSPETVAADVDRLMTRKSDALGDTPVYYISIKPSIDRVDEFDRQTAANTLVAALAASRDDLTFVDIVDVMMADGAPKPVFISDDLHMNTDGYALWTNVLGPVLEAPDRPVASDCKEPLQPQTER